MLYVLTGYVQSEWESTLWWDSAPKATAATFPLSVGSCKLMTNVGTRKSILRVPLISRRHRRRAEEAAVGVA